MNEGCRNNLGGENTHVLWMTNLTLGPMAFLSVIVFLQWSGFIEGGSVEGKDSLVSALTISLYILIIGFHLKSRHEIRASKDRVEALESSGRQQTQNLSYDEALSHGAIEKGIAPLVLALNNNGMASIASCEGHGSASPGRTPGWVEQRPYVMFRAPLDKAKLLAKQIAYGTLVVPQLHYCWQFRAHFTPDDYDELAWVLKLEDVRIPGEWDRAAINQDILTLSHYVENLAPAAPSS